MAIEKVLIVESQSTNPYENLALEEYLFDALPNNTYILYLWQNDNTVVIGYNQNPLAQCNMKEVHMGSTYIARRLSGGGAVWHDMGNLNFTFIAEKDNFSKAKHGDVLLEILRKLGFGAVKDGRNDIVVSDKKISGNAYYEKDDKCLHHGTILINSDLEKMNKVLVVDKEKWKERGIDSVRSRVGNLSQWINTVTIDSVKSEFKSTFEKQYDDLTFCETLEVEESVLGELVKKYSSKEWIFGREIPSNFQVEKRFEWGDMLLKADMEGDVIKDLEIYSDALEVEVFDELKKNN